MGYLMVTSPSLLYVVNSGVCREVIGKRIIISMAEVELEEENSCISVESEKAEVEVESKMDIVRVKELAVNWAGFVICFQFRAYSTGPGNEFGKGEDLMWAIQGESSSLSFNITEVALGDKIVQGNGSNGLLLCYNGHNRHYSSVWNPATGALHHLPRSLKTHHFPMFHGFGFDPTTHSYVLVRGYDFYPHERMPVRIRHTLFMHVYRFKKSYRRKPKWAQIVVNQRRPHYFSPKDSAIFSRGIFYWLCDENDIFAFKPPYNEYSWEIIKHPRPPPENRSRTHSLIGCDGSVMVVYRSQRLFQMWQLTDYHQWHAFCDMKLSQFGELDITCLQFALQPTPHFLVLSMPKRKLWLCNSVGTVMWGIDFTGRLPRQRLFNVCAFHLETTPTDVSKL